MRDFSDLSAYIDSLKDEYGIPACELIAEQHGKQIYRHGYNVRENDLFWIYSCSKISTCTAALQLIEQERLHLEDPVSRWFPEFARPSGTQMTVRHLMSMTGGLDYELYTHPNLKKFLAETKREDLKTLDVIRTLGTDPFVFEPGTEYRYSMCHDVLGAIVEKISGERLSVYCRRHIFEPLGMDRTEFSPSEETQSRIAEQYCYTDDLRRPEKCRSSNMFVFSSAYDSGGAGVVSCAEDYVRLMSALSMGGADADGNRILQPETVKLFAVPQLSGKLLEEFHENHRHRLDEYNYALGVRVLTEKLGTIPAGLFGWDGAASAMALADPENEIGLFFVMHVLDSGHIRDEVHPQLVKKFYDGFTA